MSRRVPAESARALRTQPEPIVVITALLITALLTGILPSELLAAAAFSHQRAEMGIRFGDAAQLQILGVSADKRYLAFEEFGEVDGGPAYYSNVFVVDVLQNAWAAPPVRTRAEGDTASIATVRRTTHEKAEAVLRRFAIDRAAGPSAVTTVLNHLFSDTGVDPHAVEFAVGAPGIGVYSESYQLRLTESDAGFDCDYFGPARMMSLSIRRADSDIDHVLQRDVALPESRGCVLAYRIESAHLVGHDTSGQRSFVAFLNVMVPGFEGRSMRYMAVSGVLPHK